MRRLPATLFMTALACGSAHAESLRAVRPLPGYTCMQLTLSAAQLTDPKIGVPIHDAPSRSAPTASYAANVVIVQDPPQPTAGFLKVLRPTGQEGWIEAGYLHPWSSVYDPTAKCVPSLMSNGKPGFGFRH